VQFFPIVAMSSLPGSCSTCSTAVRRRRLPGRQGHASSTVGTARLAQPRAMFAILFLSGRALDRPCTRSCRDRRRRLSRAIAASATAQQTATIWGGAGGLPCRHGPTGIRGLPPSSSASAMALVTITASERKPAASGTLFAGFHRAPTRSCSARFR
jgi:hypothetical protein